MSSPSTQTVPVPERKPVEQKPQPGPASKTFPIKVASYIPA